MIEFYSETDFTLDSADRVEEWLGQTAQHYSRSIQSLEYIFVSDEQLWQMNMDHLQHDTYTDILTFDYSEGKGPIVGEIYISVDRVKDNASELGIPFVDELHRVIAHGLLHIIGFMDETPVEEMAMRRAEDLALGMRMF